MTHRSAGDAASDPTPDPAGDERGDGDTSEQPLGGDTSTANRLQADNAAEQEVLKALDPESPSS